MKVKNIILFCMLLYIALISFLIGDFFYNDSTFPINGYSQDVGNRYLYFWSDKFFGNDTLLDTLRGFPIFITNYLGIFQPKFYYFFIFIIGYISLYIPLSYMGVSNIKKNILILFFLFNPFTLYHLNHFLIIQGYYITPLLIFSYYKIIKTQKYFNFWLLTFLIGSLFLGQPHNYSNLIIIIMILNIYLLFNLKIKDISNLMKKNVVLIFLTLLFYSFILIPALSLGGSNSLLDSSSHFSGFKANILWSKNSNIFDVFQILNFGSIFSSFFNSKVILLIFSGIGYIVSIIISYFIFNLLLDNNKRGKEGLCKFGIIISIGLILIHKVNFGVNGLVYKLMPHISVSTNYAVPILLLFLILLLLISNKNKLILFIVGIFQILFLYTLTFSQIFSNHDYLNVSSYNNDTISLKNDKKLGYELLFPNTPKISNTGFQYDVSPIIFGFDSFTFPYASVEQTLSKTRDKYLSTLSQDGLAGVLNYFPIKYLVNLDKKDLKINGVNKIQGFKNFDVYKVNDFPGMINNDNSQGEIFFYRENNTKYLIRINNISNNITLNFLQSYHKGWKLYLEPVENFNCKKTVDTYYLNNTECTSDNIFYKKNYLSYLNMEHISDSNHKLLNDYANQWIISKDIIISQGKENISKKNITGYPKNLTNGDIDNKYFIENRDGTIDAVFSLYFKPQMYFYIGLIISLITFLLIILISLYHYINNNEK